MRQRHAWRRWGALAGAVALAAGMAPAARAGERGAAAEAERPGGRADRTVTLVTGDRVTVTSAGSKEGVLVEPGEGRDGIGFVRGSVGDGLTVIPSDALELVRQGRVDERLFDVKGLIAMGYDDASRATLPLIVRYAGGAAGGRARTAVADAAEDTGAELPSVGGQAVEQGKEDAEEFWSSVTGRSSAARATLAPGVSRVWLDGAVRAALDRSAAQVGAPRAWERGLTGKGVRVAVLDTGVDATHPDLADAVAEARDFTGNPAGAKDGDGHGTHVASIITGGGSASGGAYRGVAPDARLLVGKVLDDDGYGQESQIIAGMQWAADSGADVVNMSLGGEPTDGSDPMAQAVDTLSASSGALFVAATGNDHGTEMVSTPASADAALAVGAVDRDDLLADFSNRGPRVGDHAVKPEITAPGVGIVAARAAGTRDDQAVDEHHTALSGTSMATPHVAGAAAVLAQEHPEWDARRLKAALVSTAEPGAGLGVFEQGTGRVDLARATGQGVHAVPGALSTVLPWGRTEPVTKQVTYHNDGDEPLTLRLSLEVTDGAGEPAEPLALAADSVTVPAHGTAAVPVTTRPDAVSPGTYSGTLTATGPDGVVVRTALSVRAERETHPVTLDVIDRDGSRPAEFGYSLIGLDQPESIEFRDEDGRFTGHAPPGRYTLTVFAFGGGGDTEERVTLMSQEVVVGHEPLALTADARPGVPVTTTVDSAAARPWFRHIGLAQELEDGTPVDLTAFVYGPDTRVYAVPTARPVTSRPFSLLHVAILSDPLEQSAKRRLYNLAFARDDSIPANLALTARDRDLARVETKYHGSGTAVTGDRSNLVAFRGSGDAHGGGHDVRAPGEAVEFFTPGPDFSWNHQSFSLPGVHSSAPGATYRAGRTTTRSWNTAAFGPLLHGGRCGDFLHAVPSTASPSAREHTGGTALEDTTGTLTLLRDGEEIASSERIDQGVAAEGLPDGAATYTVRMSHRNASPSFPFATRTEASWSFTSATDDGAECDAGLPLLNVRVGGAFRLDNTAPAHLPQVLTVSGERTGTFAPVPLAGLTVEASFDDGRTWQKTVVTRSGDGTHRVVVPAPGGTGTGWVGLRTTARDGQGATVTQEVIRAYGLR
ncbi:S8 family serine peptidase [Streptomyces capparidis]